MKKQTKQNNKLLPVAVSVCAVAVIAVIAMAVVLCIPKKQKGPFVPPAFEPNAVSGTPTVDTNLGYSEIYQEGMNFRAWVCGNVTLTGKSANVYFTNPDTNEVWMKLRISDEAGNILGESGILKPGEYVKTVELTEAIAIGTKVHLKIMTYEPETYYSEGAVGLITQIGGVTG